MHNQYIPNDTEEIREQLVKTIGIKDIEDLFLDIPPKILLKQQLNIPGPFSELEVKRMIETILKKNRTIKELTSFLGAGIYPHYVPALVDEISSRGEFLTSYTPYQPEISQGILQALFEYQSMLGELLDMDVVNCSMYDWASSIGEAARMATRVTQRHELLVPHYMSPERMAVLKAYTDASEIKVMEIDQPNGSIDLEAMKKKVSKKTAGVYIENPSYLGFLIESIEAISEIIHDNKGLLIMGVDPTHLGFFKPPGEYRADIVVGEGQPLGNYLSCGGPLLGIFACRDDPSLFRQMPGRIVGMTSTMDEKERAFCMILQTREQHIRRHKATSNICTNVALYALRAAVYMSLLGPQGFRQLGEMIFTKTWYAIHKLSKIRGLQVPLMKGCHFKEFTVNFDHTAKSIQEVNSGLLERGILGGKPLNHEFPELGQTSLYCVTELHTLKEIDNLKESLIEVLED